MDQVFVMELMSPELSNAIPIGCLARLENNLYYCVEADISIISRKKEKILQQIEVFEKI